MPVTRIKNNQITDASAGNTQLGVNAAVKLQNYTVTATKIANNLVYGSDLTVTGNLTVQGNTTTIDTTITTIEDPVIVLASTQTSGTPTVDIGFLGYRGNVSNIAFVWDESATEFVTAFTSTGETNTTITITSYANFHTNDANIGGNLVVGGNISITGNVSSLNVTGNITGGNLLTPGQLSATGNVTGGNIRTAGVVTATSNITGGNLLTGGLISATSSITSAANITGGNVLTGGQVSATATITGGNLATGGTVSATGNITGGNILFGSGVVSGTGNVYATNFIGNISGNIDAAGANTEVQFNDGDLLGASAAFTFNKATNVLAVGGQITSTGTGNLSTGGGQIYLNGTGNNRIDFSTAGTDAPTTTTRSAGAKVVLYPAISVSSTDYALGVEAGALWSGIPGNDGGQFFKWYGANVQIASLSGAGVFSALGNITGGNILTGGVVSATSNITGGNVLTGGLISATSTITSAANITGGNLLTGGLISATSTITSAANITGGNLLTGGVVSSTGNISSAANIIATANIIGGNVSTAGLVTATGNVTGGNILTTGIMSSTGNGIHGNVVTGGVVTATGNIQGGNILTGGLISATSTITSAANITGGNVNTGGLITATGNVTGGNIRTAGLITATGNITGGNILTGGLVSATGNVTGGNLNLSGNIVDSGALTITSGSGDITLNAAGNISAGTNYINNVVNPVQDQDAATKIYVDNLVSTAISYHEAVFAATDTTLAAATGGTITYNQPNGAGNGIGATLTTTGSFNLIDTANVQTANTRILVKNEANAAHNGVYVWSNATVITRSSDTNTYGAGNVDALGINDYFFVQSGNVNAGSAWIVDAPTGTITFGTSLIQFAQFSSSQTYTANTSAGLSLVGTVFLAKVDNNTTAFDGGGNIIVKAGANLTTPNIGAATGTSLSVTGNVTGGNLLTGGAVSATGNVTGGNITTAGVVTATGNVTGGNVLTGGLISATSTITSAANITGGNLLTGGLISATSTITSAANITGGNILTGGLISATANITGGNLVTGGLVTATGNVTGGNVLTGGLISATSTITSAANITGGNISTAGLVTATGNVTGGNIRTAGLITATGNITGGNLLTGGLISATSTITSAANISGGNILTGGAVSATGNVTGGNLLFGSGIVSGTGNIYANTIFANISGNIDAAGANTQVQFADTGDLLGASANFTFNKATNLLTVSNGNIVGGNLLTGGLISATSTITSAANIIGGNITTAGLVTATGNVTGGNLLTAGIMSSTGNGIHGNILTGGLISATSTITSAANITGANLVTAGLVTATGNVTGGNVNTGGLITATGNVTGGNIRTAGLITATGNITGANLILTSGIVDGPAAGRITINGSDIDTDFAVDGDTVANIFYVDAGTGTASFGSSAQTVNALVAFNSTNSVLFPVGNTAQRPGTGVTGMIRFNTTTNAVEIYDNTQWTTVGTPSFTVIADEQFAGDGVTTVFTLATSQTTNSCIVSINGVLQIPTLAYSVSTTTLTFTEAPALGDVIDVREITTTTTITSVSNAGGNAVVAPSATAAQIDITGNLIPVTSNTYTLGNSTNRWANLFVSGNSIYLGNLILKENPANVFVVYLADGVTQANIDVGNVDVSAITSGTSTIGIYGTGQAYMSVNGNANVLLASNTSVLVNGAFSATGNITGNYIFGNGSQLTGIDATSIQSGTSNVRVVSSGGNVATGIGGTSNVVVVATTGQFVTGVNSVSGNITGGNILTAGVVSATGNITGNFFIGNGSQLTGIDATAIQNGTANVRTFLNGNVTTSAGGTANVLNVTSTGAIITGDLSVTGNATLSGNILGDRIQNGNTTIDIQVANGNANVTVGGTSNVAVFATTGLFVTGVNSVSGNVTGGNILTAGLISATGNITGGNILGGANVNATTHTGTTVSVTANITGGNILTGGLISATGNITGNFIFGNGSQLTGIDATSIQSGTSNVRVVSSGGNVATGIGGTANVVVVATTGQFVTGVNSVSGNVTGGNILTAGLISAAGVLITGGDHSLTGNIVDTGALFINTGSNGNITINPNGTGVVILNKDLLNGQANGVGNIGNATGYFNTIFAKATSAQYADLAEKYTADATYEPGTVVMFSGTAEVTICGADMCKRVAGVISTNPSYRMNDGLVSEHTAMVALTGRVPTKVTGTVRKGDLMVSAGNGTARAEADPKVGTVIGKALADFDGTEGVIEVVVGRL